MSTQYYMYCMMAQYSVLQAKLSTLSNYVYILALWGSQKVGKSGSWESEFDFPESATVCRISPLQNLFTRDTSNPKKKKRVTHR